MQSHLGTGRTYRKVIQIRCSAIWWKTKQKRQKSQFKTSVFQGVPANWTHYFSVHLGLHQNVASTSGFWDFFFFFHFNCSSPYITPTEWRKISSTVKVRSWAVVSFFFFLSRLRAARQGSSTRKKGAWSDTFVIASVKPERENNDQQTRCVWLRGCDVSKAKSGKF